MGKTTVGVIREVTPGERRVSLTPESVARLKSNGFDVIVETDAGTRAWFADADYQAVDATIVDTEQLYRDADILTCVGPLCAESVARLRAGHTVVGLLEPLHRLDLVRELIDREVTAISLDLLPRKLSRAQSMDALSSQANIAGYKAALVAANAFDRYFPMLTTAAGTSSPATVLILGTGVAGLSAIGTARRLGAVVTAYDVRPEAKGEVESLGARFLKLESVESGAGSGGYAREMTAAEREAQQAELTSHIGRFDVVITTAKVPGRKPPLLVTQKALDGMRAGSVVVDMAAGELGGNVELSKPDTAVELPGGVTVIGAGNLASELATAASTAYARNLTTLLTHLSDEATLAVDLTDEITAAVVTTMDGRAVNPQVAELVASASQEEGAA